MGRAHLHNKPSSSLGNEFFSLLGVASLAFCAIFFENFTLELLKGGTVRA